MSLPLVAPRTPADGAARARGFSFIEVMIALSMLLVGALAVLPLFALGVQSLAQRRLAADLVKLRPEVRMLAQQEIDKAGGKPKDLDAKGRRVYGLSLRGYDVQVEWAPAPDDTPGFLALAAIRRNEQVVHVLPPIAIFRSLLDPSAVTGSGPTR